MCLFRKTAFDAHICGYTYDVFASFSPFYLYFSEAYQILRLHACFFFFTFQADLTLYSAMVTVLQIYSWRRKVIPCSHQHSLYFSVKCYFHMRREYFHCPVAGAWSRGIHPRLASQLLCILFNKFCLHNIPVWLSFALDFQTKWDAMRFGSWVLHLESSCSLKHSNWVNKTLPNSSPYMTESN